MRQEAPCPTCKACSKPPKPTPSCCAEQPDNPTLLKIYGLFKQATLGDNTEKKPSFSDFVARAKWDAWTAQKGLSADEAKQKYIDLIESLRA